MNDKMTRFLNSINLQNIDRFDMDFDLVVRNQYNRAQVDMLIVKETPWDYSLLEEFQEALNTIQYPYSVKKTMGLGAITFSCSLLQLLATYICVSNFGKDGIKISIIIGSVVTCLGVWIYSNKVYPMPWLTFWKRK